MLPVSIIIVTWNALSETRRCLESLWACGIPRDAVVVVDNGSTDGTLEHLRTTGCRLLENGKNLGFAAAVNRGLRLLPPGHDVVLLNNDVWFPSPGWLERLRRCSRESSRPALVAPRLAYPDGRLQEAGIRLSWEPFRIRHHAIDEPDVGQFTRVREVAAVSFACIYLPRQILDDVGPLDEDYFCYFEDVDFCLRVRKAGFGILCCGDLTIPHVENATTRANPVDYADLYARARGVFDQKWPANPFPYRGAVDIEAFPDGEPETVSVLASVADGLEDLGFRVSLTNRSGWSIGTDDDPFRVAQMERLPSPSGNRLMLGSATGLTIEVGAVDAAIVTAACALTLRTRPGWIGVPTLAQRAFVAGAEAFPPPVDPNYFHGGRRGSSRTPFTFAVVAPWAGRSSPHRLAEAFRSAFDGSRQVRLVWAATGELEPEPCAVPPGVEIRRLPQFERAARAAIYAEADALVIPAGLEPWGLAYHEALQIGLPIIATSGGTLNEELRSAGTVPVEPDRLTTSSLAVLPDVASLTARLREIAADPVDIRERALRAREVSGGPDLLSTVVRRLQDHPGRRPSA